MATVLISVLHPLLPLRLPQFIAPGAMPIRFVCLFACLAERKEGMQVGKKEGRKKGEEEGSKGRTEGRKEGGGGGRDEGKGGRKERRKGFGEFSVTLCLLAAQTQGGCANKIPHGKGKLQSMKLAICHALCSAADVRLQLAASAFLALCSMGAPLPLSFTASGGLALACYVGCGMQTLLG